MVTSNVAVSESTASTVRSSPAATATSGTAGTTRVPAPVNELNLGYLPGSHERTALKSQLKSIAAERIDIPIVVDGREIRTGRTQHVVMPHNHRHVLADWHAADAQHVHDAIAAAKRASREWANWRWEDRAAVFLRAAELLTTSWRQQVNAATMLGQSKTAFQAEIDSACELIDFLRFNAAFAHQLHSQQPLSAPGIWDMTDYRPLDGFVFAVTPFNFTSIGVNLPTAPALMGNTVILKPASTAIFSAWTFMQCLREAGLPEGVINFVPGKGSEVGRVVFASPHLGGVHFTGSTSTFNGMWKAVAENISRYRQYPRLVGETGGKDFIFAHPSAADDLDALATAIVRGGYEYQGQKCSACSRVYVAESVWSKLKPKLQELIGELRVGDPGDFRNFMGAVIDEASFRNVSSYIDLARKEGTIVAGGETDRREGWFVKPTLVQVQDPRHRLMVEEIFAPVVSVYVYPDAKYAETLQICDTSAPYALTGAIFARDRKAIATAMNELRFSAGNFYINDKPTGAVVGQQPFGGSRASGTNDKAGSALNLVRWTSARTIKENFVPPTKVAYPYMGDQ
jgi:1-pyrroline-5-carboxylate dehydrogenase